MLAVRQHWFGASAAPAEGAIRVREPSGELLMLVDTDGAGADRLVESAARHGSYVVVTDFSRPRCLVRRLRMSGFRRVHRHGVYTLEDPPILNEPSHAKPGGLLGLLRGRLRTPVEVRQVGAADLPVWNRVCWLAFGRRHDEADSLAEKRRAYDSMGSAARWYLATVGGKPAGTAILYQEEMAAQVLAVGTLPVFRRMGVATAVMRHLIRDWLEEGVGLLFLDTAPGGPAERLYQRLGFRRRYVREVYAPVSSA